MPFIEYADHISNDFSENTKQEDKGYNSPEDLSQRSSNGVETKPRTVFNIEHSLFLP